MHVVAKFPFNCDLSEFEDTYSELLQEIYTAIEAVNAKKSRTKKSKEKTKKGQILYSPTGLNKQFKKLLIPQNWLPTKESCEYSTEYYLEGYSVPKIRKAFREMDFIKDKLGVEVQFGKYSFMVYNVCAKMTIFKKLGHINAGVEIVPVKRFSDFMSSGVSYFEQFTWDLTKRGVSNIDIPVLILGIDV